MLYCVVCFYNENCDGNFTIDYIFRDKLKAVQTAVKYTKFAMSEEKRKYWLFVYETDSKTAQPGSIEDFNVYLDHDKKKLYMFTGPQDLQKLKHSKIPLPSISTKVITEFD